MGEDVATSKYLWRVIKKSDGTDALLGTDYIFVTSYTNFNTPSGADQIALATTDDQMKDHTLAIVGQNEVYIKWLVDNETYDVTARVFDVSSGCSDDVYNVNTFVNIHVGANTLQANLKWDVAIGDESDIEDCAIKGNNTMKYTVSIIGLRAPKKLDGSATPAELVLCKWRYKYEYNVCHDENQPGDLDAGWVKGVGTSGTVGDFVIVDFNLGDYNNDADGDLNIDKINTDIITVISDLDPGDGKYYVWVKITKLHDGYGTKYEGDQTLVVTKAIINQIPVQQIIESD